MQHLIRKREKRENRTIDDIANGKIAFELLLGNIFVFFFIFSAPKRTGKMKKYEKYHKRIDVC